MSPERYWFGPFQLDPNERKCLRGDNQISLVGKAFDLLLLLLQDPRRILTKAELMNALWPETKVEESNLTQTIFLLRKALGDDSERSAYIQTVPRLGYKFVAAVTSAATPAAAPPIQSIAVIPLRNLSGDPRQELFADAITEALIANLARIRSLDVISRTSVMRYKGTTKSLPEIARELGGIDAIVEGSVQRSGRRVRIRGQLIRASTDKHLWANEYDRDLSDVLTLEAEVARAIAQEIQAKITPEESRMLSSARRINAAAHDEYFLGLNDLAAAAPSSLSTFSVASNGFSQARLNQANQHFLRATQLDPGHAEGYAGQAEVRIRVADLDGALPLVQKALELDPTLAEPRISLARIHYERWEWADADREFRRAAELNPSSLDACTAYAQFLFATGRFERGIAFAEDSLKKHPFSDGMEFQYGSNLYGAGRYEEAVRHLRRAAAMDSKSIWPPTLLFEVYRTAGKLQEALALVDGPEFQSDPWHLAIRGRAYALVGRRAEALEILNRLTALGPKAPWVEMHLFYFDLGDMARGFDLLNRAFERRAIEVRFIKFTPAYASVRSDPRFQKLAARLNMPDLP